MDLPANKMRSYWFLTWNNYTRSNIVQLCAYFSKYIFQEELSSTGTPHLQGCMHKRCRFSTLKNKFPSAHWEVCKNVAASKLYCSKLDTRNGKVYTKGLKVDKKKTVKDYFTNKKPYLWQQNIIDLLVNTEPDERKVYWY